MSKFGRAGKSPISMLHLRIGHRSCRALLCVNFIVSGEWSDCLVVHCYVPTSLSLANGPIVSCPNGDCGTRGCCARINPITIHTTGQIGVDINLTLTFRFWLPIHFVCPSCWAMGSGDWKGELQDDQEELDDGCRSTGRKAAMILWKCSGAWLVGTP
jgi:hypothetical protein